MKWLAGLLLVASPWLVWAAPGSWTGEAPSLRLAVKERHYHSSALQPVGHHRGADVRVTSIWWRYTATPTDLAAFELCRGERCVPLPTSRGRTDAFSGWSLEEPFYFRARLASHARQPVELGGLQLIVNYH